MGVVLFLRSGTYCDLHLLTPQKPFLLYLPLFARIPPRVDTQNQFFEGSLVHPLLYNQLSSLERPNLSLSSTYKLPHERLTPNSLDFNAVLVLRNPFFNLFCLYHLKEQSFRHVLIALDHICFDYWIV